MELPAVSDSPITLNCKHKLCRSCAQVQWYDSPCPTVSGQQDQQEQEDLEQQKSGNNKKRSFMDIAGSDNDDSCDEEAPLDGDYAAQNQSTKRQRTIYAPATPTLGEYMDNEKAALPKKQGPDEDGQGEGPNIQQTGELRVFMCTECKMSTVLSSSIVFGKQSITTPKQQVLATSPTAEAAAKTTCSSAPILSENNCNHEDEDNNSYDDSSDDDDSNSILCSHKFTIDASVVACATCSRNDATCKCNECGCCFCNKCFERCHKIPILSLHQWSPLKEPPAGSVQANTMEVNPATNAPYECYCKLTEAQSKAIATSANTLYVFCTKCDKSICKNCAIHGACRGHKSETLQQYASETLKQLLDAEFNAEQNIKIMRKCDKYRKQLLQAEGSIIEKTTAAVKQMEQLVTKLNEAIKRVRIEGLEQANKLKLESDQVNYNGVMLQQLMDFHYNINNNNSNSNICSTSNIEPSELSRLHIVEAKNRIKQIQQRKNHSMDT